MLSKHARFSTDTGRPRETEAEILEQKRVSGAGFLLTLSANIPVPRPGQFVMLGLPAGAGPFLRRPFSVLEFDAAKKRLEVFYSIAGSGTAILSRVGPGEKLGLLGPLGRPFPAGFGGVEVMVGGGRGVSPLVFLSRKRSRSKKVLFLAGAPSEERVVFLERVRAWKVFVSTDDGSLGRKGTVIDLLQSVASFPEFDWSRATLYGCGPAGMLARLHKFSLKHDVPCFVSLEARMGCGVGVCQGCGVKTVRDENTAASSRNAKTATTVTPRYSLVCKDGPVFDSGLVDWDCYHGADCDEETKTGKVEKGTERPHNFRESF